MGSRGGPVDRRISHVALSRSGRWLAGGTPQGRITVWDRSSGARPRQFDFARGRLNDLRFSPDEQVLAIASRDLALYVPEPSAAPRLIRSDQRNYGTVRFSRDGQTLLVIDGTGAIQRIDASSGATRVRVCCSSVYGEVAFTPDGQFIVNAGHWPRIWDAGSGELARQLTTSRQIETFGPIAIDDGNGAVLMGSQDGRVYAWDLETRRLIATSAAQPDYVDGLAVSITGWVAYAGFGRMVRLWNPRSGRQRSLDAARPASNLVFGPDGVSIIFGTDDGTIETWDTRTGQRLETVNVPGW